MTTIVDRIRGLSRLSGPTAVWTLSALVAIVVAAGTAWAHLALPAVEAPFHLDWYELAPAFYAVELAVVHMRFRRNSYSFSLSEIPVVLGLFFSTPADLVIGHVVGTAVALHFNRHQSKLKLAFNVANFGAQALAAVTVFRIVIRLGEPLGGWGWVAAFGATAAALVVSDYLVTSVIVLSGGRLERREKIDAFIFGFGAAMVNGGLALLAVTVAWERPQALWLASLPAAIVFVAYRVYTSQREERLRLQALYDMTLSLHDTPVIEDALRVAADRTRAMFSAEVAQVLVLPEWGGPFAYLTEVGIEGPRAIMRPTPFDGDEAPWSQVLASSSVSHLHRKDFDRITAIGSQIEIGEAMAVPLRKADRPTGLILVANPLADVGTFGPVDLQLLETVAGRVAVSLDNGRLEDNLTEVTRLKEQLEEAVRSKDQFIAAVSHELRTPLTGIVGLAQELRHNRGLFSEEELDEFLGLIYEQSTELGNIVEDLLVAARADMGTLIVKPADVEITAELAPVLATHARKATTEKIDETVHGDPATASVDPLRFRQIMRNLVTNAVRYGGANIWVEVERVGSSVRVAVIDDGEGVPHAALAEIFEPYGRGANARLNPSSVGLGLSVSRQLARLMSGDLVYERAGGLTRFVLTLPAAPGP